MALLIKDVAHRDAQDILDDYWDGQYPVDPISIADHMGITVWEADLPEDVSGQLVRTDASRMGEIYLNKNELEVRRRFTCAHEIGHWVDRQTHNDTDYSFTDYRDASRKPDEAVEWYADHFAANLLMPTDEVNDLLDLGFTAGELSHYFDVSPAAVRVRLRSLGRTAARV